MRGLKYVFLSYFSILALVASFLDAWIEIANIILALSLIVVASFLDAWIEITRGAGTLKCYGCRILLGCVD